MKKALEDLSCRHRQKDEDILFSIVCYSDTNLKHWPTCFWVWINVNQQVWEAACAESIWKHWFHPCSSLHVLSFFAVSTGSTEWTSVHQDSSAPADAAKLKKMLDGFKIPAAGEEPFFFWSLGLLVRCSFFCVAGWFCLGGLNPVVGDNYGIVYGGGFRDTQESGEFDIPKRTCTMLMHLSIFVMFIFFVFVYWAPSRLCHKSQGCSKLLTLRVKLSQCPGVSCRSLQLVQWLSLTIKFAD